MKRQQGLTIIQIMVLLLIAGVVGSVIVNYIIDERCESDPSRTICAKKK
jgi:hypothetical protein